MQTAPLPTNEDARLKSLKDLGVLDTGPEQEFDALVRVASLVCGVPISLISLVDSERQWFKANIGLPGALETPRDIAFCAHAILDEPVFEVPDATKDPRFADNPLVASEPDIRFYAGAPIVLEDGSRIGTLCVIDRKPRQLDDTQREVLRQLAVSAAQALEGRRALREIKRVSAALYRSELMLERTGKLAGIGGFEMNFQTGERIWAHETFRIYGLEPGPVPSLEDSLKFYPPEARAVLQAALAGAMAGGGATSDFELPFDRADGKRIWVRTVGTLEMEGGKPLRMVGLIQDISARREEQINLQEAQERVKLATESAGIGIWDLDLSTFALNWNEHHYRLYGLQPTNEVAAYDLWSQHVHPDDLAATEKALQESIATGNDFSSDFRIIWPDGSIRHIKALGRMRFDAQGKPVRMVGTNMDVTDVANYALSLKEARDKAEDASRSKGQFLANMSHEIRTPMNAILGLLQLLRSTELNANQCDYVDKTEGAAKALLGLLNDILDFSKIEAGKMELEAVPFSVDKLMRNLGVVLSASVGQKNIEVLFDIDSTIPDGLLGDSTRLLQVLINLGGNAVKFTSVGHVVISVRLEHEETHTQSHTELHLATVQFSVRDTGIGISTENQAKVFSDFSQAEASTTRNFGGTGLGLAISKRMVSLMGGELKLESALGTGTTFKFNVTFPISSQPVQSPGYADTRALNILLVDDNKVAQALITGMMLANSWSVEAATSAGDALEKVRRRVSAGQRLYDFVFLDWQLSDMDVWAVVSQLHAIKGSMGADVLKVVMVSANGRDNLGLRTRQEQSQICGFLQKPVTRSMLMDCVQAESKEGAVLRQSSRSSKRELQGLRILVVEDNAINQQVAEGLLGAQGAMVSIAADGRQGVNAIASAKEQYDLVLMDVQMPVMDGYQATKVIREQMGLNSLPIIGLTANAMDSDREKCLASGMNEHVGKPFDLAQLVSLIIRLTGHRPTTEDSQQDALNGSVQFDGEGTREISSFVTDTIDLPSALARMGGMHSLYVRTARDMLHMLPALVAQLREAIRVDDRSAAISLLHTYKGTTATLGLRAVAAELARLEKLCKSDSSVANWDAQLCELSIVVKSGTAVLNQAIELLDRQTQAQTKQAAVPDDNVKDIAEHVAKLLPLLKAQDMSALDAFAQSRQVLENLPVAVFERLETALQGLDFEAAWQVCQAIVVDD